MVLLNSLEMSNKKRMRPSTEAIAIIIKRERMTATGAYNTVKSNPSSMDDLSTNVLEHRSNLLSMSVFLTLKDILGLRIFVSGGSKESKNGTLNVVDVDIFS